MPTPIENYRRIWSLRTPVDMSHGRSFYREAWRWCQARSDRHGFPAKQVAYCVAAISPMKKWDENLRLTDLMLYHLNDNGPPPPLMKKRFEAAYDALVYRKLPSGPKVSCFAQNIAGDLSLVTVDRHMMDMAECTNVAECQQSVTRVADRHSQGLWPAEVQAVLWYTWRRLKGYEAYVFTP